MPSADPQARLRHMLENIDAIVEATRDKAPAEIVGDYREPDVPWRDIIGIGNLLRHEYYRIRAERMVDILNTHLPRLRPAVVRLLAENRTTPEQHER
jgi:uncharacterized protein with HEPN domain